MNSIAKWAVGAVLSVVTTLPVAAQEVADWNGFYAGLFVGDHASETRYDNGSIFTPDFGVDGALAGGLVGYNWQRGNFVFGVEGDIASIDANGSFEPFPCNSPGCISSLDQMMTLRGRVGVAHGNSLFYATLGTATVSGTAAFAESDDLERSAMVYGLGAELMVQEVWSVRLETLFFDDFGTEPQAVDVEGNPVNVRLNDASQIRIGVIRRF